VTTYQSIVFAQGDDASEPLDILDRDGVAAAVAYLAQWDYGDENGSPELTESGAGQSDRQERHGDYLLTWNSRRGYIGLERVRD
jgi:hypothetical protein